MLGRSPEHRKALYKNLASSLFLTERDAEGEENAPKVPGRVVTTLHKAKEIRPLVEKCITIAKKALPAERQAEEFECDSDRGTAEWKKWRESDQWQKWAAARAPAVAARRRVLQLLGDKEAVSIVFDEMAERFEDRPGGYTRILRLATPRLGDAGAQAIIEFVGKNDRVKQVAERPAFADDEDETDDSSAPEEASTDDADDSSDEQASSETNESAEGSDEKKED